MVFTQLWQAFSQLDEVEAIALGGSRAQDVHDNQSDYDLYIYCRVIPSPEKRLALLEKYCSYIELGNHYWELEDDCQLSNGIPIDILYRDLSQIETDLRNVVEDFQVQNAYTTCLWYNIEHSRILYDRNGAFEKLVKEFKRPYPKELKSTIVRHHLNLLSGQLPSYDQQIIKAAKRQDFVSVNHRVTAFLETYFDLIFALNGLPHPGEKRMLPYAMKHAKYLPNHFQDNIDALLANLMADSDKLSSILSDMLTELERVIEMSKILTR